MSHFSSDGNAPTHDQLMTCPDCGVIVDCGDERIEFHEYICEDCFQKRVEELRSQEGDEENYMLNLGI